MHLQTHTHTRTHTRTRPLTSWPSALRWQELPGGSGRPAAEKGFTKPPGGPEGGGGEGEGEVPPVPSAPAAAPPLVVSAGRAEEGGEPQAMKPLR